MTHHVSMCMTLFVCLRQVTLRTSCWTRFLRRRWKWRGIFVETWCACHARMKKVRQTQICVYRQIKDSSPVIQGVFYNLYMLLGADLIGQTSWKTWLGKNTNTHTQSLMRWNCVSDWLTVREKRKWKRFWSSPTLNIKMYLLTVSGFEFNVNSCSFALRDSKERLRLIKQILAQ